MPYYDYICHECNTIFEDILLSIDQRDVPCTEACPSCEHIGSVQRIVSAPRIGDAVRIGRTGLPASWTDKLSKIKSSHYGSTMNVPTPNKREI